ncbi:hypothetical protein C8R43DRAFT_1241120 [Mycena crocata]|nr:hypothetical protein C8R43DRAFT_1241120 [Mycena crocata]
MDGLAETTAPEGSQDLQSNAAPSEAISKRKRESIGSSDGAALEPSGSSKRKRDSIESTPTDAESPSAKHSKSSHRHAKHWDLEGDLFVRIDDCWMRLRKSSLTKQSEWFTDVFSAIEEGRLVPEPKRAYAEGTVILVDVKDVQKCYHVPALGVSAADFGLLLTAVDAAISYCHNPPSFPVISAILRAATDLKFPMFRDWAVQSIQQMWCPSLSSLSTTTIPHATETVILGRAWGVPGVLKRSLYELLRTPGFGQDNDDDFQHRPTLHERRLLPADILCLVNTREQLDSIWHSATSFDVFSASHDAPTCAPIKYVTYKKLVHDTGLFQTYRFDVLCGLEMLVQIDWEGEIADGEGKGLCALCVSKLREKWQTEREKTWEKLNDLFRLGKECVLFCRPSTFFF